MSEHVRISNHAGVLRLTRARPAKKNALTNAMYGVLANTLREAGDDPSVRAVLFDAEGDAFTAGNDVGAFAAAASGTLGRAPRPARRSPRSRSAARRTFAG